MSRPALELRTLGGLSLRRASEPVTGAGAQRARLAVLAVIAVAGERGISRDRLLALFWPESDTERARGALKQALYALRRDAGVQELTLGTSELRLNPTVIRCDAVEFERAAASGDLEHAAALYAGPFLDGVYLREAPEFERWADGERDRLARLHLKVLEKLAGQAEKQGDGRTAAEWWRRIAALDPLNAGFAVALMRALATAGDGAAALRHVRVYSALVQDELGLPPDPAVLAAAEEIRASARDGPAQTGEPSRPGEAVAATAAASRQVGAAPALEEHPVPASRQGPAREPARPWRERNTTAVGMPAIILATVVLLSAVGLVALGMRREMATERILVEPFLNATNDPAVDAVAEMITEWVTQGLAAANLVQVIDSRSVRQATSAGRDHAGPVFSPRTARDIGATTLVRGALFRRGGNLVVETRVVRAEDDAVLFTPKGVTNKATDPAQLAEDTRQVVLGAFAAYHNPRFSPWARAASTPPRYDAWLEFVAGLNAQALENIPSEVALEHYIAALRLDTTFVQAMLFALSADLREDSASVAFRDSLARVVQRRRDQLTPYDQASVDVMLAARSGDTEASYRANLRRVDLAPWSPDAALSLSWAAQKAHRFRDGARILGSVSPGTSWLADTRFLESRERWLLHLAGDYEEEFALALRQARDAGNADPEACMLGSRPLQASGLEARFDSLAVACGKTGDARTEAVTYVGAGHEYVAHGHVAMGRRALLRAREWFAARQPGDLIFIDWCLGDWEAIRSYWSQRPDRDHLDARGSGQLGVAAAHLGDRATALAMARRIESDAPPEHQHWRAMVLAALGELDEAVDVLRGQWNAGHDIAGATEGQCGFLPLLGHAGYRSLLRDRS